jgi:alkanesulfonate monooxygenase SsuD/methylene tetrahydromethanopterin reductase-like flavin-dependent oxidoreductase (luciferase family)
VAGRNLKLGESVGVLRGLYLADNKDKARELADAGIAGVAFRRFFYHFGFFEAWREPADEAKWPAGKMMLPAEECNVQRMERADFAYLGTADDVKKSMDAMVENVHPEWFVWQGDQGFLPKDVVKRQIETFGKHLLPRYK